MSDINIGDIVRIKSTGSITITDASGALTIPAATVNRFLDEGITLAEIKARCLAMGAGQVLVAVLSEKILDQDKPIRADFVGLELPNRYVFGCGMDAYGWWRNLPCIRALKDS